MISVVTFKWNRRRDGLQLPRSVDEYTPEHVNILFHSVKRNTTIDHRFICVTDDSSGLHDDIEVVSLWDYCQYLGGCYNRLYIFSKEIEYIFGPRFIMFDLDCVITGNIDHILGRPDDFIINEYNIKVNKHATHQYYNGGIIMMSAGSRSFIWDEFDPESTPNLIQPRKDKVELVGSDQAWISHRLGPGELTFTPFNDGVYDYRKLGVKKNLPENASIVMFAGKRDPLTEYKKTDWIKENWYGSEEDMKLILEKTTKKNDKSSRTRQFRNRRRYRTTKKTTKE